MLQYRQGVKVKAGHEMGYRVWTGRKHEDKVAVLPEFTGQVIETYDGFEGPLYLVALDRPIKIDSGAPIVSVCIYEHEVVQR